MPIELPYTDCCDPAYLSLKATFSLGDVPEHGLGLIAYQQADNFHIRVNGSLVHAPGRMQFGGQSFHGQRAYLVRLPAGLLHTGENELSFITVRDGYPYTDLYPLSLGEYGKIEAETANRFWQTIDLRKLGGWLTFILGLFALILLIRSKARRLAGWLVALCWSWTAFAAYGLVFDPIVSGLTRLLIFCAVNVGLAASLLGFIDAWSGRPVRYVQAGALWAWAAFNVAVVGALYFAPMPLGFDILNEAWIWTTLAFAIAIIVRLLWHFGRVPEVRYLEAALLSICAVCLALDAIGERFGLLSGGYLMDSAPLLLLAFVVAFVQRNFTLFQSAMELNNLLEGTVKAREAELEIAHSRERELVGHAARSEERRRMMRDMHDGVGGQLMGLLLAVRRGKLEPPRIAQGLQEVMDEVRLMLDSVDVSISSLASMLALFETRTKARAADVGIHLVVRRELVETLDLPPQQVLALFRILQEATTNAIKHSGADRIEVRLSAHKNALVVKISDNGVGMGEAPWGGHGIGNMRNRAVSIGALLSFGDAGPGAIVRLEIPIDQGERKAA